MFTELIDVELSFNYDFDVREEFKWVEDDSLDISDVGEDIDITILLFSIISFDEVFLFSELLFSIDITGTTLVSCLFISISKLSEFCNYLKIFTF